ncbi:P-loop containing nucleoside triphosphate hydrolase protein [Trametopsis cervina]|nr:P-loop containing nucleoside triphosphate hydrolase protein [Trametopsis cervina]
MAKKKKTQLKPVARGFATTSVAKKPVPEDETPEDSGPNASTEAGDAQDSALSSENIGSAQASGSASSAVLDPREQALQDLVDTFQDRIEREVTRTIKAIEQERRFADTLPPLDLDSAYTDRIIGLVSNNIELNSHSDGLDEPEDRLLTRLAITYGVLRRLGFSEAVVVQCLESVSGVELEDAFDWLHVHCSLDDLLSLTGSSNAKEHRTPLPSSKAHPQSPSKQAQSPQTSGLNASAAVFVPHSSDPSVLTSATLAPSEAVSGTETPTLSVSDSDSLDDDLTASYVKLKLKIDELTVGAKANDSQDDAFLSKLTQRLNRVRQDYLFDVKEAEQVLQRERKKVYAQRLEARLKGLQPPKPPHKPKAPETQPAASIATETPSEDVFDNVSDSEEPGGLLDLLQAMPETETSAQGTTVHIRDFPLPKHWSGRTPRFLLQESVHKSDRYAITEFLNISGHSRAKRATVRIRWNRDQDEGSEWTMDDVACYDEIQAENYVATIALHALTFPPTPGFAIGTTAAASQATSFRLLPPRFRDLWGELEEKRKADDNRINRTIWSKLKSILDAKLSALKAERKGGRGTNEFGEREQTRGFAQPDLSPEQIMTGFQVRVSSQPYQEMLEQRQKLPIAAYRNQIIDTLANNQILVLSGETGCGKSTQLPAFILEDQLSRGNHCKVYCTEPRRISAISLAQRVSQELGEPPGAVGTLGSLVGYSIRLESNTSRTTRLAYVTNGIALRMLESGSGPGGKGTAFDEITHIIIDEVHERTIESDFMLIVLKSLLKQRPDLKVVLMSATLDADKISSYFDGCPVLQVPGRTFPVEVMYLEDAVELTKWTINESSPYAIRAKDKYSRGKQLVDWSEDTTVAEDDEDDDVTVVEEKVKLEKRYSSSTAATINLLDERLVPYELIIRLLEVICLSQTPYTAYSSAVLIFMPGMGEIRRMHELLTDHPIFSSEDSFKIHPLHSSIASDQQGAVFDIPPHGIRKIVIATNIAETGITIPDITCVIDTGHQKEMRFDEKRQLSRLVETFVAQSNAKQRRGRAGRVQSGLCFHLFTKARYETKVAMHFSRQTYNVKAEAFLQLAEHPDPEMMRLSLSDLSLRIKIMKISLGTSIEDVLSRALDPPSSINIQRAISALVEVGALTSTESITPLGRLLSKLPTDVHLGKFLLIATVLRCLDPALTIAATLNSKSPFLVPFGKEAEAHRKKLTFRLENSDFLTIHQAFASWRQANANGPATVRKFCRDNFLSHQNLQQIEELRQQFLGYLVDSHFIAVDQSFVRELNRARFGNRGRARLVTVPPGYDQNSSNFPLINAALAAGLYPKVLSIVSGKDGKDKFVTITNNQAVALHPSSVNFGRKPRDFGVNYLSYYTIMQVPVSAAAQSKRMYAWETGPVDDLALVLLCGDADFKLMAHSVTVDRKVRFRVEPKTNVALKYLRNHIGTMLSSHFRGDKLGDLQTDWEDLALLVLGKVKPQTEKKPETITLVTNRRLD